MILSPCICRKRSKSRREMVSKITFARFTHRAGFHAIDDIRSKYPVPTYAGLTVAEIRTICRAINCHAIFGEDAEYSNLGMGQRRLCFLYVQVSHSGNFGQKSASPIPLGMKQTAITMTPEMLANNTQGYNKNMQPTQPFEVPVLEGWRIAFHAERHVDLCRRT